MEIQTEKIISNVLEKQRTSSERDTITRHTCEAAYNDGKRSSLPTLALVIPCYNEEAALEKTACALMKALDDLKNQRVIHPASFIYFVDDGSGDMTWNIIMKLHDSHKAIKGVKLARNVGHQNAILAGLLNVKDRIDCAITIDADLQDDITVIKEMVKNYTEGCEIVYGVRSSRDSDTFFKKNTALLFYRLMRLAGVNIIINHADYRLTSRRVIEELKEFREVNLFLRGIFPSLGFKSTEVYYKRSKRIAGETKYPLKKMLAFAFDGITSFSVTPMRVVTLVGAFVFAFSLIMSLWSLWAVFFSRVVPGWASIVVPIYFLGGVQLLSIGIIGEYIGKVYKEVKGRPRYIKELELF